jgi:hypothetical protein
MKYRDQENSSGYIDTRKDASKPASASCNVLPTPYEESSRTIKNIEFVISATIFDNPNRA